MWPADIKRDEQEALAGVQTRLDQDLEWYGNLAQKITGHERELLNTLLKNEGCPEDPNAYSTAFNLASLVEGIALHEDIFGDNHADYKSMTIAALLDYFEELNSTPHTYQIVT
jgi:hypothetical protein